MYKGEQAAVEESRTTYLVQGQLMAKDISSIRLSMRCSLRLRVFFVTDSFLLLVVEKELEPILL